MMRAMVASVLVATLAAACTEDVSVGRAHVDAGLPPPFTEPDASSTDDWPGCLGRTCGEGCPPRGVGPALVSSCDYWGACVTTPVPVRCDAPTSPAPCEAKVCGDACTLCPIGATNCSERRVPKRCNARGLCVEGAVTCS